MEITLLIPILRQLLTMVGGYLVGAGYFDEDVWSSISGVLLNGAALAWWAYDRWQINKANRAVATVAKQATSPAEVKQAVVEATGSKATL